MTMPPRNIRFRPREYAVGEIPEGAFPANPEVYWWKRNLYLNHIARQEVREAQMELIKKRREESRRSTGE